jgi:hypothetical protein
MLESIKQKEVYRVLVTGVTGTGKSLLSKHFLASADRLIVVDSLAEWGDTCLIISEWPQLFREVQRQRFRLAIQIPGDRNQIEDIAALVRSPQVQQATLVIDELSLWFVKGRPAGDDVQALVRFGRRQQISLWMISQRWVDCPTEVRSQLSDMISTRDHDPQNYEYLKKVVGSKEADRVQQLKVKKNNSQVSCEYLHWDVDCLGVTSPDVETVTLKLR